MGCVCLSLVLLTLTSIPLALSGVTPALRQRARALPVAPQQTNLEYAQSPADFIASNQYNQKSRSHSPTQSRPADVITGKNTNSFTPALPYNKLPPTQNAPSSNRNRGSVVSPKGRYPTVSLYNNRNPNSQHIVSKHIKPSYSQPLLHNSNQAQGKDDMGPENYTPPQQFRGTNNFPKSTNQQDNLNFNLFNSQDRGGNPPYFSTNDFGTSSQGRLFQPQGGFYNSGANSRGQGKPATNNNNYYDPYNSYNPILSQGFSIPTTYNGGQSSFVPNEAFASVTDPSKDKRSVIGSYVPANNFVNPSNFLIPTEDKHTMIDRIFGGFQRPMEQSQPSRDTMPSRDVNKPFTSPTAGPYYNSNAGGGSSTTRQTPSANYGQSKSYGNLKHSNNAGRNTIATQVTNKGPSFTLAKTFVAPGYGRRFNDKDSFSFSPSSTSTEFVNSPTQRQETPTLLFSDFSYNSPLRLDDFRSKNLLGDENFGQTEYDKKRVSSETLLGNNNFQSQKVFTPSSNARQANTGSQFGGNRFEQVGGSTSRAANSFDNFYRTGQGYDKNFDDSGKTTSLNGDKSSKQDFSDNYSQNNAYNNAKEFSDGDAYNNAKEYSDGDGYSNSYRYSDGGSDSDYNSKDDQKTQGFKNSYQNRDDQSNMDSYNNADGYNREFYNGKNYDVTDGYTDNVNYNNKNSGTNKQSEADYRRGVASVAGVLSRQKPVQPYRGLPTSATNNLPEQANYIPFDVNKDEVPLSR